MPDGQSSSHKNAPPFKFNTISTKEDYQSFIQIPWRDFVAEDGSVIGLDAQLNEGSTETGKRIGIAFWNSTKGDLYKSMYTAGNLKLIKYQATIL
ncbi:MAG: hypothetical protein ATN31_07965 [Candidatus Epulonipiscioides saccharophilum]|nr:MAG: hypothetical protein ATN31_07965 [Epulopiscium sp. AS2M-Bin001]